MCTHSFHTYTNPRRRREETIFELCTAVALVRSYYAFILLSAVHTETKKLLSLIFFLPTMIMYNISTSLHPSAPYAMHGALQPHSLGCTYMGFKNVYYVITCVCIERATFLPLVERI